MRAKVTLLFPSIFYRFDIKIRLILFQSSLSHRLFEFWSPFFAVEEEAYEEIEEEAQKDEAEIQVDVLFICSYDSPSLILVLFVLSLSTY